MLLHLPSPDWRDQVIYFAMTDRFDDGNPANNDQGQGEFRAGSGAHYNGGDLAGLSRRLAYVQGLGATALWITPPVTNQWWNGPNQYSGYHGYWASRFDRVDPHLGSLADYQRLSDGLHRRGMYLVQDIVLNHTGDFFHYAGGWDPQHPELHWQPNADSRPTPRPAQWPFNLNNPTDPAQRRAGMYHWTPDVSDYADRQQELNFQMSGLDDLNTENPVVRRALRKSYGDWIRQVGVDAFRVDTAFYVPDTLFEDFLHARDKTAPGVAEVARRTGRNNFLVFGEGFGIDAPGQTRQSQRLKDYMAPGRLGGMLNFPLYGALGDAFARGRPTQELADRITQQVAFFPQLHSMPSFVDNHDVDRFLAGGKLAGLRQALLATMTLPGIPTIYYGTEQGFTEPRAAMFAAGVGSGGRDHFDPQAPLYRDIAAMTQLRREQRLFSRGTPQVLRGEPHGPGALAWRTDFDGQSALVVFNTADHAVLLDGLATGWAAGQALQGVYGLDGKPADQTVAADGSLSLSLAPRAGLVWLARGQRAATPQAAPPLIDTLPTGSLPDALPVSGTDPGGPARAPAGAGRPTGQRRGGRYRRARALAGCPRLVGAGRRPPAAPPGGLARA